MSKNISLLYIVSQAIIVTDYFSFYNPVIQGSSNDWPPGCMNGWPVYASVVGVCGPTRMSITCDLTWASVAGVCGSTHRASQAFTSPLVRASPRAPRAFMAQLSWVSRAFATPLVRASPWALQAFTAPLAWASWTFVILLTQALTAPLTQATGVCVVHIHVCMHSPPHKTILPCSRLPTPKGWGTLL